MTTEQREAIDRFKHLLNLKYTPFNGGRNVLIDKEAIDTALSLIKEQQEEIGSLQKELNEENKRSMILANNDKFKEQVIDLMAKCIDVELSSARLGALLNKNVKPLETYKEDIKQYFANKVNSSEQN